MKSAAGHIKLRNFLKLPPEERFLLSGKKYTSIVVNRGGNPVTPPKLEVAPVPDTFSYNEGYPAGTFKFEGKKYRIEVPRGSRTP